MKEKRKPLPESKSSQALQSTNVPADFLKMVREVYSSHYQTELKAFSKYCPEPYFQVNGKLYQDEIVLAVSLCAKDQLSATTVYSSIDFDPNASAPKADELLKRCVDGINAVFASLLKADNEKALKNLAAESLSALEDVPFQWAPLEVDKRTVHLKIDKSNPELDQMADQWLEENDPNEKD